MRRLVTFEGIFLTNIGNIFEFERALLRSSAKLANRNSGSKSTSALQPTQLWAGADSDLVPEEFSYCNTAGWPAQIAPVRRSGDFLFFSGLLGYEEPCKTAVKDSTKQVEMAFHWMDKTLKSAGIGWIDLVSVTSYHA